MASLIESPAAEEFLSHLPLTIDMHEHLERQKEVYLPFSLSEGNLKNPVYEYKVGDIVYWHPGPTMGIFHNHDGRRINSGVQVLARLESQGAAVFASYPDAVKVTIELEGANTRTVNRPQSERQLKITLDGKEAITAVLVESPATEEFLARLPFTLNMTDYANREKHAPLSFSIGESKLLNIQQKYEIGDVIYYPPGPTFAMFYAHDGNILRAGFELVARLNRAGIEALAEYKDAVEVTVELGEKR